jgi:hypothetical protein
MAPLWIGISNVFASRLARNYSLNNSFLASPQLLLTVLTLISTGTWIYTLIFSPHSPSTLFLPTAAVQTEFVPHVRRGLQFDEVYAFGSSFLWITYQFYDLRCAGLAGTDWFYPIAVLPVVAVVAGPGSALALGWYWREEKLLAKEAK